MRRLLRGRDSQSVPVKRGLCRASVILWAAATLGLLWAPASAPAGTWRDPEARVFTLQRDDGPLPLRLSHSLVSPMVGLPDGSLLFTVPRPYGLGEDFWWLHVDGRLESLNWAGPVDLLAVDAEGAPLIVRSDRPKTVERLDLARRDVVTVADLSSGPESSIRIIAHLAGLDDGSIVVADSEHILRIDHGAIAAVPFSGHINGVAALSGGAFAVDAGLAGLIRVNPDGSSTPLVKLKSNFELISDGSGGLLTDAGAPGALTSIDQFGHVTRYAWDDSHTLGDGDGVELAQFPWGLTPFSPTPFPLAMAVAGDGSLVFATSAGHLRALVPPDSARLRVAIDQRTYQSFARGQIQYRAGVPGALALEVRQGRRSVARTTGTTTGGEGTLLIPPIREPNEYDLRLRLDTGQAVAEARARLDTRRVLSRHDAVRALTETYAWTDADEGGGRGAKLGPCHRLALGAFTCLLLELNWRNGLRTYDWNDELHAIETPQAIVNASLRADGIRPRGRQLEHPPRPARLQLTAPRRQRLATHQSLRAQVTTPDRGQLKLRALIQLGDNSRRLTVRARPRQVRRQARLIAELRLTRRQTRQVLAYLARRKPVTARIEATLTHNTPSGPANAVEWRGLTIVR